MVAQAIKKMIHGLFSHCPARRSRLKLESLDERIVPTFYTFNNPLGGSVAVGSNFIGGIAPSNGDSIVIPSGISGVVTFPTSYDFDYLDVLV